jgi:hypothetical protein
MRTRATVVTAMLLMGSAHLHAQRVEVYPFVGYRFGGGFSANEVIPAIGQEVDLNLESGFTWGGSIGVLFADVWEAEFLWSRQEGALSVEAPLVPKTDLFDMAVTQYHGNVLIHLADEENRLRPYVLFGLGTTYIEPNPAAVDGVTKFSYGLGAGIKAYASRFAGIRAQFRWAPTYVSTSPGVFCSVFCYSVDVADYANQSEVTVGVSLAF